jgi:hypothetical protein
MSSGERCELNDWVTNLFLNNHMDVLSNGRFEKKLLPDDGNNAFVYSAPGEKVNPLVFEIKKRIEEKERLTTSKHEYYLKDFVAVVPKNGFIHKHTDPNEFEHNLFHVRFNVFISVPPNDMSTYYGGNVINAVEGCYVLCRSGIDQHWSDINMGDIPRISLSFGYLLPAEKVDALTCDASVGTYSQYYPLVSQNIACMSLRFIDITNIMNSITLEKHGENGSCIYTAANVFTESQCDFIVNCMNENSNLLVTDNNVEYDFVTLHKMKLSGVPYSDIIDSFIFEMVGRILVTLTKTCSDFKGMQDDGYTLRRIHGGTKRHVDGVHSKTGGFKNFVRCLSMIIVLNDDYDGGIFNFPAQNLKFKVKKGEVVMFPPYWTHPHSVTSVGEGQARYTINTWILEKFLD